MNVSSVCGMRSFEGLLAYCMSKAALDQFTKCTALELIGKGVRVNSINPGRFNFYTALFYPVPRETPRSAHMNTYLFVCYALGVIDTNFHDSYGLERNGPEYQAVMDGFAKMHPIGRVGQVNTFDLSLFSFLSEISRFYPFLFRQMNV